MAQLTRGRLPLSAVAIGCMAPDFEFFIRLRPAATYADTAVGLLMFNLPLSMLILIVWQYVMRRPMIKLIPGRWSHLAQALDEESMLQVHRPVTFIMSILAILAGMATHFGWDAFTHSYGLMVQQLPVLQTSVPIVGVSLDVPVYMMLQAASGLFGLAGLAWLVWAWARRQQRTGTGTDALPVKVSVTVIAFIVLSACGLALVSILLMRVRMGGRLVPHASVSSGVIGFCTGAALAALAYSMAYHLYLHRLAVEAGRPGQADD